MKQEGISDEEAARRRRAREEADIAAEPILKRLTDEVNARFGFSCARVGDLKYVELTEPVLDYLVASMQSERNFRVRAIIASVLHEAKVKFDVRGVFICFFEPMDPVSSARGSILDMLRLVKPKYCIEKELIDIATRTDQGRAGYFIFYGLRRFVKPEIAEKIIRDRFEDNRGLAAESLGLVGNLDTVQFLNEKLAEVEEFKRQNPRKRVWYECYVRTAIKRIEKRLAKKLIDKSFEKKQ
ncbi:MAG: hypothetical protein U0R49_00200 [Fimbriimonadales bacterium]